MHIYIIIYNTHPYESIGFVGAGRSRAPKPRALRALISIWWQVGDLEPLKLEWVVGYSLWSIDWFCWEKLPENPIFHGKIYGFLYFPFN